MTGDIASHSLVKRDFKTLYTGSLLGLDLGLYSTGGDDGDLLVCLHQRV